MIQSIEKTPMETPVPPSGENAPELKEFIMPDMVDHRFSIEEVHEQHGSDGIALRTELTLHTYGLDTNPQIQRARSLANAFHCLDKRSDGVNGNPSRHIDHVNRMFLRAVEECGNTDPVVITSIFLHDAGIEDHPLETALSHPNLTPEQELWLLRLPEDKKQTYDQKQQVRIMAHESLSALFPERSRPDGPTAADVVLEVSNPIRKPGESKQRSYDTHMEELDTGTPEARFVKGLDGEDNAVLNHYTHNKRVQLSGDVKYAKHFGRYANWLHGDSLVPPEQRGIREQRIYMGSIRNAERRAEADPQLLKEVKRRLNEEALGVKATRITTNILHGLGRLAPV